MRHILQRHAWWTTERNVGRFLEGINARQIVTMIHDAVQYPNRIAWQSEDMRWVYDRLFPNIIGHDRDRRPTRWLRVVVAPDGTVITAFPIY